MKTDQSFLQQSLSLAYQGRGHCAPNPAVGAIITNSLNEVIAAGYHTGPGNPHAEIEALKKINYNARDLTLYVTLEPCCHIGKTPPCTDAIIQSGIKRVVYGYQDPNPIVFGKGAKQLTDAGIVCDHVFSPEVDAFYKSYYHWHTTKQPFVTAKIAMTLDGKIAGEKGERIQITGKALQEFTHYHRKLTDAILTTAVTIKNDNSQLNARYQNEIIPKTLYILDSHLTLSPESAVFKTAKTITIFHAKQATSIHQKLFEELNVRCIPVEQGDSGLDLQAVIKHIGQDGIHDLWIEAGGKCFSSFLKNKLVQRSLIYVAPRWLGKGLDAFSDASFIFENLDPGAIHWQQVGVDSVLEWEPLFNSLNKFSDDFMEKRNQPKQQEKKAYIED